MQILSFAESKVDNFPKRRHASRRVVWIVCSMRTFQLKRRHRNVLPPARAAPPVGRRFAIAPTTAATSLPLRCRHRRQRHKCADRILAVKVCECVCLYEHIQSHTRKPFGRKTLIVIVVVVVRQKGGKMSSLSLSMRSCRFRRRWAAK